MKVIILTNLFPYEANLSGGIFITKRLEQHGKLGIDYVAVPVWFQDDLFVRIAKYLLRKSSFIPATNVGDVDYSPLKCRRTVRWLLWEVLRRISEIFDERAISIYSQHFAECVEKNIDLSAFDLIHAHGMYTPPAGLIAQILSQKYSKPYVLTVHGSDVNIFIQIGLVDSFRLTCVQTAGEVSFGVSSLFLYIPVYIARCTVIVFLHVVSLPFEFDRTERDTSRPDLRL